MSVLSKLLHRGDEAREDTPEQLNCPHTSLIPHWDNPAQLGKPELARYQCESCHQEFSYAETQQLMQVALPPQQP